MKRTAARTASGKTTRRTWLRKTSAAGLSLAAMPAVTPLLFSDDDRKAADKVKVGILHSLSGILAISESSLRDMELVAIAEINKAGGVLGKKIEPIVEDAESKFTDVFPEKAKKLVVVDEVAAVFGCWTSVSRKNVLPIFELNNALLFYPMAYEGNECSKNVIYTGAVPNQHVQPAVDWLLSKEAGSRKKIFLLGSDYVYPRTANLIVAKYLDKKGVKPADDQYVPLGHKDFGGMIKKIKDSGADAVLCSVLGDSLISLFDELATAGIGPEKVPVLSLSITEDELRGLEPKKVKGHFAAATYFQSIDSPDNKAFIKRIKESAAIRRVKDKDFYVTDPMEAAYTAVYLWKNAVEKAKSFDIEKVRTALADLEFKAPGGTVKVDDKNQHLWKRFRVGRIRDDGQFDVVYESKALIRPDPYTKVAFPDRDCDWTKGGVIRR
jgi:urea transport system substrate-binding protein